MKIKLTIDRFEGEIAVLMNADNHSINWPKNNLPQNSQEGDIIFFNISLNESDENEKKFMAKDILKEILKEDS